jgi:hypothetical protein
LAVPARRSIVAGAAARDGGVFGTAVVLITNSSKIVISL